MTQLDWKNYFETNYADAGALKKLWNVLGWGYTGTGVVKLAADSDGNLKTVSPSDSYTLAYTGDRLDSVTRTSDSKTITLGYTGDNLTSVSDWA